MFVPCEVQVGGFGQFCNRFDVNACGLSGSTCVRSRYLRICL